MIRHTSSIHSSDLLTKEQRPLPSSRSKPKLNRRQKESNSIVEESLNLKNSKNQRLQSAATYTITNQSRHHQKTAYQLYSQRQSARVVGSMLSSLSKSDKKRCDDLRKETDKKRKDKQYRKKNQYCQNRIETINSMRHTYLKHRNNMKVDNHINIKSSSYQQEIPSYRKAKVEYHKNSDTSCMQDQSHELKIDVQSNEDNSMRELIDWLENVDIAGIDDFI